MIVNLMPHLVPQCRIVCDEKHQSIKTIERAAEAKLPTKFGEFRIIGYRSFVSDHERMGHHINLPKNFKIKKASQTASDQLKNNER